MHNCDTSIADRLKSLHNLQELFTALRSHGIKIAVCTADNREPTMKTMEVGVSLTVTFVATGTELTDRRDRVR